MNDNKKKLEHNEKTSKSWHKKQQAQLKTIETLQAATKQLRGDVLAEKRNARKFEKLAQSLCKHKALKPSFGNQGQTCKVCDAIVYNPEIQKNIDRVSKFAMIDVQLLNLEKSNGNFEQKVINAQKETRQISIELKETADALQEICPHDKLDTKRLLPNGNAVCLRCGLDVKPTKK